MMSTQLRLIMLAGWLMLLGTGSAAAESHTDDRHIRVVMRMVGHEVLLSSGDSNSRIMPIVKDGNRYAIPLGPHFDFATANLVKAIDEVMTETQLAESYRVEMENCETEEVVYSYEIGSSTEEDLIPCQSREQLTGCYRLMITLIKLSAELDKPNESTESTVLENPTKQSGEGTLPYVIALILTAASLGLWSVFAKRKKELVVAPIHTLQMGTFLFDKHNMELVHGDEKTELTGKESELLDLLFSQANNTVNREDILKTVWGDEGGYIGRTLDVFISRLRKKLEADPTIKIINIRGVGYKLVVND